MSLANLCNEVNIGERIEFVLEGGKRYSGYRAKGKGFYVSSFFPSKEKIPVNLEQGTIREYKILSYVLDRPHERHTETDEAFAMPRPFSDSMSQELDEDREKNQRRLDKIREKDEEDDHGILGDEFS